MAAKTCEGTDISTAQSIASSLLTNLSRAAVFRKELFKDIDVEGTKADFTEFLNNLIASNVEADIGVVPFLDREMLMFAEKKKTTLNKMAGRLSTGAQNQKVKDLAVELRAETWPLVQRDKLARSLIKRFGRAGTDFCGEVLPNDDLAIKHKLECGFRPIPCNNDGCGEAFAANLAHAHDALCLYKIVSCAQMCPLELRRIDMQSHFDTTCPNTAVPCFFGDSLGCCEPVTRGTYDSHLKDRTHQHLVLLLKKFQDQQQVVTALAAFNARLATQIDAVVMEQNADRRQFENFKSDYYKQRDNLESSINSLRKDHGTHKKELTRIGKVISPLDKK
eukprot:Opistho-2@19713